MAKLNLNTYPYYDDFDLNKNFHRVLFKPGYAVQARELTQLQTVLQDQIKRFGDNIFKEGSVISGCPESTNFGVDVVKILDTDTAGQEITDEALLALEGKILVGKNNLISKQTGIQPPNADPSGFYVGFISDTGFPKFVIYSTTDNEINVLKF